MILNEQKKTSNHQPHVTLIDFGATQSLQPDMKIVILEDGSRYPTGHVRYDVLQYPSPEVLMDLKFSKKQVDAWFIGVLICALITGGKIPFD